MHDERRQYRRYGVSLEALAVVDTTTTYKGKVTDISFSGVRFVCDDAKIDKDQRLDLILKIENQDVTLQAVVVWSGQVENLEGVQHGMKVVGVKFVGDRKQLEKFFTRFSE